MNLSYPANFYQSSLQSGLIGSYTLGGVFPSGMTYGCAIPETVGTTTYPNTACVDSTGTPLSPEACTCLDASSAPIPGCQTLEAKCLGKRHSELERIYNQKTAANKWQAGYATSQTPLPAEYIDWGDNLEGRTWPVQVLRVETNTFSTTVPTYRFDMWHIFGQGTNELWGVHSTNPESGNPLPYVYAGFPYSVNVSGSARLNIAKLYSGADVCPATATGSSQSPFLGTFDKNARTWVGSVYTKDMLYGAELNIKGSYVYGYNWNLRSDPMTMGISKSGWWRLTFYTPDDSIIFSQWVGGAAGLAPPLSPLTPAPIPSLAAPAAEGETGLLLYVPQVDPLNHLTYLDICISEGHAGGGGKGGR
ncbi:MAG: hypothetical protein J0H49_00425 [Acidobacteria bacterium]|nr:hypothetical protein [Acidobacteriota bacterium]